MNNSSKKCCPLLLCTLFLAIMATLIMTSDPVFGSRSLARPSNRKNDVTPNNIKPKDVHRSRKLDQQLPPAYGQPSGGSYKLPTPPGYRYGQPGGGRYGPPIPLAYGQPGGGSYGPPIPPAYGQPGGGSYGPPIPPAYGQPGGGGYYTPPGGGYSPPVTTTAP
ncbi:hypothetical protein RND81_08G200000 [Saponaria officinalis]|uniref:Uncharacterized protein n=3 Tax=Saponaria officinalis TaxID=3572 RepID=A0AAW1JBC2_SAPOF